MSGQIPKNNLELAPLRTAYGHGLAPQPNTSMSLGRIALPENISMKSFRTALGDYLIEQAKDFDNCADGWLANSETASSAAELNDLNAIGAQASGGLAIEVMASRSAKILAVIGSGTLARSQIEAALELRDLTQIRLYARQPVAATELAKQLRNKTSVPIEIVQSPEEAVHRADIIVLATDSTEPVVDADWVAPHAHISSLGPNRAAGHELPYGIIHRSKTIAANNPQQIWGDADYFLQGERAIRRIRHFGDLIEGFDPDRGRHLTLYLASGQTASEQEALQSVVDKS